MRTIRVGKKTGQENRGKRRLPERGSDKDGVGKLSGSSIADKNDISKGSHARPLRNHVPVVLISALQALSDDQDADNAASCAERDIVRALECFVRASFEAGYHCVLASKWRSFDKILVVK